MRNRPDVGVAGAEEVVEDMDKENQNRTRSPRLSKLARDERSCCAISHSEADPQNAMDETFSMGY
jgi:hypothetical protein